MPYKPFRKDKIPVYLTLQERGLIRVLAANAQLSLSEWVRRAILQHPEFIAAQGGKFAMSTVNTRVPMFGEGSEPDPAPAIRPNGVKRKPGRPMFGDEEDD